MPRQGQRVFLLSGFTLPKWMWAEALSLGVYDALAKPLDQTQNLARSKVGLDSSQFSKYKARVGSRLHLPDVRATVVSTHSLAPRRKADCKAEFGAEPRAVRRPSCGLESRVPAGYATTWTTPSSSRRCTVGRRNIRRAGKRRCQEAQATGRPGI